VSTTLGAVGGTGVIVPNIPQSSAAVATHYDELDRFYREIWGEHVHHGLWRKGDETPQQAVEHLVHFMAQQLGLGEGDEVCDVGCGYGASAELLAKDHGVHATGVTISQAQHERAAARLGAEPRVEIHHGDWLDNHFADERFDAVYAIESTEHMDDKQRFFDEAFRTLRPGGRLGVYAWLSGPEPGQWAVRLLLEPICREGRLAGMGTAEEYRQLAQNAGFTWESYHDLSGQVAKTWRICLRRFLGKVLVDPSYLRYIFDPAMSERIFAVTVLRILAAYRLGAMQYGLLIARKP